MVKTTMTLILLSLINPKRAYNLLLSLTFKDCRVYLFITGILGVLNIMLGSNIITYEKRGSNSIIYLVITAIILSLPYIFVIGYGLGGVIKVTASYVKGRVSTEAVSSAILIAMTPFSLGGLVVFIFYLTGTFSESSLSDLSYYTNVIPLIVGVLIMCYLFSELYKTRIWHGIIIALGVLSLDLGLLLIGLFIGVVVMVYSVGNINPW